MAIGPYLAIFRLSSVSVLRNHSWRYSGMSHMVQESDWVNYMQGKQFTYYFSHSIYS